MKIWTGRGGRRRNGREEEQQEREGVKALGTDRGVRRGFESLDWAGKEAGTEGRREGVKARGGGERSRRQRRAVAATMMMMMVVVVVVVMLMMMAGTLMLYNRRSGERVTSSAKHKRRITCGAWSEDGQKLAVGSEDRQISICTATGDIIDQVSSRRRSSTWE